jgi:chromosome segregation ATPase
MNRAHQALIALVLASLGLWGCAKAPTTDLDRVRALEVKLGRVEEDFRTAASARDQLRQRLAALDKERALLLRQVAGLQHEREELLLQVQARAAERDQAIVLYDAFRKELRQLLGQAEAVAPSLPSSTTTTASN